MSEIFEQNFNAGKTQLVHEWVPSDLETPVSAYLKLCADQAYSFLFESVEGGTTLGRYSIIGFDPDMIWTCDATEEDGLASLREALAASKIDAVPDGLPPMAVPGLYGYIGYDMVRLAEKIEARHEDTLGMQDSILMRPSALVIFDNVRNMICVVTAIYRHAENSKLGADIVYRHAKTKLQAVIQKLAQPVPQRILNAGTKLKSPPDIQSNINRAQYGSMIAKAKEYILAGDIFQVVLSQRFTMDFDLPSFALYRSLRRLNPSPFLFHVRMKDAALVGSSPEVLVRVRDGVMTIRPIAGTRKRGANAAEDKALAADLLGDQKECAEHLMLLDLGRNDVGRVCEFGSVEVTDQFSIEFYSHVMHIVSNVQGKLHADYDIIDALFSGFPAGTVSGAPKIRAMQIIDELESCKRGFYGGGVGYLSPNGAMDTCIALRTALIKDGKLHVQAGGGIVADSDEDFEHQETVNKAKAVITAALDALERARKL